MLATAGLEPAEYRQDEVVGAGKPRLRHSDHVPIGHERSLEDGVLAGRRPHAERVPGLDDTVARRVARHDGMHNLRVIRVRGIETVDLEPVPNRCQRAEMLVSKKAIAPVDPLSLRPGLIPLSRREGQTLETEVLWVDRFGNVQLNVGPDDLEWFGDRVTLRWSGNVRSALRVDAYQDLGPGQLGLLVDSYGLMAVVLEQAPAADELGVKAGDALTLEPPSG